MNNYEELAKELTLAGLNREVPDLSDVSASPKVTEYFQLLRKYKDPSHTECLLFKLIQPEAVLVECELLDGFWRLNKSHEDLKLDLKRFLERDSE